jgi:hypothetical protein
MTRTDLDTFFPQSVLCGFGLNRLSAYTLRAMNRGLACGG